MIHCVKSVQTRSFLWSLFSCIRTEYVENTKKIFSPNTGKYGPEKTPYLDTFHAVTMKDLNFHLPNIFPLSLDITGRSCGIRS